MIISAFIYDLRPDSARPYYNLVGLPLRFGVGLYAEFGPTSAPRRIKDWMGRMPAYVGYVLLGVGGLLWLFGII